MVLILNSYNSTLILTTLSRYSSEHGNLFAEQACEGYDWMNDFPFHRCLNGGLLNSLRFTHVCAVTSVFVVHTLIDGLWVTLMPLFFRFASRDVVT